MSAPVDEPKPTTDTPPVDEPKPTNDAQPVDEPKPTITYSVAMRAVRKLFGPQGRIWKTETGYALGIDTRPGRRVLVTGPDLWMLLFGRYTPPPATSGGGQSAPTPAEPLTTGTESGSSDRLAANPVAESDKTPIEGI